MAIIRGTNGANRSLRGTGAADSIFGLGGNDLIFGLGGNDTNLDGGLGNDTIDGGTGRDTMKGQAGNDTYIVDNVLDKTIEGLNKGTDTVKSKVTFTLAANVEKLTLTGAAAINGTGNALRNTITGNAGNNILNGGLGNDTLIGGGGTDTISFASDTAGFTLVLGVGGSGTATVQGTDTYSSIENVLGGQGADTISGNAGSNILTGGAGNDTFSNGAFNASQAGGLDGTDVFDGGAGTGDTVSYADQSNFGFGANIDFLSPGTNFGAAFGDSFIGIENIIGTGNTETISADDNANTLDGGTGLGQDVLNGRGGDDTLFGREGPDFLNGGTGTNAIDCGVDTASDIVVLNIAGVANMTNWDFTGDGDLLQIDISETGISSLTAIINFFNLAAAPDNTQGAAATPILYNDSSTNTLYFDGDGSGGAGPVIIATGTNGLTILSFDFIA